MSDDKILINGPFNTVRMEGMVRNVKKVIYLFFDFHLPVDEQTKCNGYDNIDIANYIYKNIKKTKFPLDIFMEIRRTDIKPKFIEKRDKYIWEINKLFQQEFSMKEEKVQQSKTNTNVRLHYLDIRDYKSFLDYKYNYIDNFSFNDIHNMENDLIILYDDMKNWYTAIFGDISRNETIKSINELGKPFNNYKLNSIIKMIQKDIIKIKEKYKHEEIKDGLKYSFELIKTLFDGFFKTLEKVIPLIESAKNKIKNDDFTIKKKTISNDRIEIFDKSCGYSFTSLELDKQLTEIQSSCRLITDYLLMIFVRLTDIYFLRRILDKDYIKNVVVYSGASHSTFYVQQLIQKFNFKITHKSYSEIKDINKLNNFIKNQTEHKDFYKIENVLYPEHLTQCSDLTDFPKNFE
jgi:hypothetical protein